jgi:hypothetical protein
MKLWMLFRFIRALTILLKQFRKTHYLKWIARSFWPSAYLLENCFFFLQKQKPKKKNSTTGYHWLQIEMTGESFRTLSTTPRFHVF